MKFWFEGEALPANLSSDEGVEAFDKVPGIISNLGFRLSGFGFRVSGFGFRSSGLEVRVGFRVLGFGVRVKVPANLPRDEGVEADNPLEGK